MGNEERGAQLCSHFSRLSDEILLTICCYLSSDDVVNLARTCKKFNLLLYDRQAVKKISMECAYSLTFNELSWFFKPHLRCENIKSLSLASVYWLTSGELLRIVSRLKSLRCLLIHDTQLSISHLSEILDTCNLVRQLSWTVSLPKKGEKIKDVRELASRMSALTSLYLYLKSYNIRTLSLLLEKCASLEELRMSNIMNISEAISDILSVSNTFTKITLPHLHSLVVTMSKRYSENWIDFRLLFVRSLSQVPRWHLLWADPQIVPSHKVERELLPSKVHEAQALSVCLRDIPEEGVQFILSRKSLRRVRLDKNYSAEVDKSLTLANSNISHLEWHNYFFPAALPRYLEHFCLRCRTKTTGNLTIAPLLHLRRLSVACCVFLSSTGESSNSEPSPSAESTSFVRRRTTRTSRLIRDVKDCVLKDFTSLAPNVRELEIRCEPFCTFRPPPEQLGSLLHIGNWPQLESLFLESVQIVDFSILPEIAKSCPKLRRFGLTNVGTSGCWSGNNDLVKAIGCLKHLQDFRFGHRNCGNVVTIVDALSKCLTLRRVAIVSQGDTVPVSVKTALNVVKRCDQLIFLLIRLSSITQKMEKSFLREIKTRFSKDRPALWAYIEGGRDMRSVSLCPDVHYRQMVEEPACLQIEPPPFPHCKV